MYKIYIYILIALFIFIGFLLVSPPAKGADDVEYGWIDDLVSTEEWKNTTTTHIKLLGIKEGMIIILNEFEPDCVEFKATLERIISQRKCGEKEWEPFKRTK